MIKRAKDLSLDAARKSAEAAAIVANAHIISANQIGGFDLFGVPAGETKVTGRAEAARQAPNAILLMEARAALPRNRMTCSAAPVDRLVAPPFSPTANKSGPNWMEGKTSKDVSLKSVALSPHHAIYCGTPLATSSYT